MGARTPVVIDLKSIICGICSQARITTQAQIYCSFCKDGFCSDCYKIHRIKEGTRDHNVVHLSNVDSSKLQKLIESHVEHPRQSDRSGQWTKRPSPNNNQEQKVKYIGTLAANHDHDTYDMEDELFCPQHEAVFCDVCTTDHKYCHDVVPVSEAAEKIKARGAHLKLDSVLQRYNKFASVLIDDRSKEKENLQMTRSEMLPEIRRARQEINMLLDELEENVKQQLDLQMENYENKVNLQINTCSKIKLFTQTAARDLQSAAGTKTKEGRFVKTYYKLHMKYNVYEKCLREVYDDCSTRSYIFTQDDSYKHICRQLKSVGSVKEILNPSKLPPFLRNVRDNPVQRLHEVDYKIYKILRLWGLGINGRAGLTAVGCLDNGHVIVLDRNVCELRVVTEKGWTLVTCRLEAAPWDFTFLSATEIAVTMPGYHKIVFFDINSQYRTISFLKEIIVKDECWGIAKLGDNLVVTLYPWTEDASVQILSSDGRVLQKIQKDRDNKAIFRAPQYVASSRSDVFYVSDSAFNYIVALDSNGEIMSFFKDNKLAMPMGMTFDYQGNLYVCAKNSNNIFQIPVDGYTPREIITESTGLLKPLALHFYPENDTLLVACSGKTELKIFKGISHK